MFNLVYRKAIFSLKGKKKKKKKEEEENKNLEKNRCLKIGNASQVVIVLF